MEKKKSSLKNNLVTGFFIAMVVFTVAFIVTSIIKVKEEKKNLNVNRDEVKLVQLDTIKGNIADDAPVALITTDQGQIRAELYPQYAPQTVANFKRLADSGYYDGTYVYEIQKDVYMAGGSKYTDGSLPDGYDKDSEMIEQEFSDDLWPLRGCLMSCGLQKTSFWTGERIVFGGSRFMVAGSIDFTDEIKTQLYEGKEDQNTNIEDAFVEYGGIPNATRQMTVFAQTYEGLDVLEKLLDEPSDPENFSPVRDVEIKKVEVCTYKESLEK